MVAHKTRRKLNYLDKLVARVYRKILNTIIRPVNGEPLRVVNTYDALSRVVEVLHPNEHISTYKYDMLGNVIETKTPDAGTVTAEYTPQGQILTRTTANGEVVSYNYEFERLKSVAYSLHPNDSIIYTYGDNTAENFQKGRLISVRYPMGGEEYTYGNMGEVVKTVKTIVIDDQIDKVHTYTSEFEYDSWNRIQKMIYPDGEVVDYAYYANGELKAITGEKDGITYPYLVETGYNANGQTAYRKLGNGSEQRYFYDKKDRLQTSTLHIGSERISVNTYNYDKVDNITSIHDNGIYFQNYTYDELNRLISANGYDFGESYTAYVSPYFVESNNGYTKHYYAGATRLVSKIGESVYENESYISYGDKEKDQYFYFQDHLGSSTYITDLNGEIAQYAAYTPYGELFREYRNVTPYRFNGKELDTETGLYYYGARYYNPSTALWLGVDPLARKYPGVSPYVYCHSNPINRIDPDGRADYYLNDGELLGNDGNDDGRIFLLNDNNIYKDFDFEIGGKIPSPLVSKLYESSEEVDGLIIQKRVEEGADYTISEFHTVGIKANTNGFILEPGGPSTAEINKNKRIPEGVYNIKPHSGKNYKDTYKLYNSDVPEWRAILYHAGNTPNDTRGCNLPGKTRGEGIVYNSRKALDEIKTFISSQSGNNIKTIITNRIR